MKSGSLLSTSALTLPGGTLAVQLPLASVLTALSKAADVGVNLLDLDALAQESATAAPAGEGATPVPAPTPQSATATPANDERATTEAETDAPATPQAEIVITGSRLSSGFQAPTPVTVLSNERVQALANGSPNRSSVLPDVPTTEEAGYKGSGYDYWAGLLAPNGTSQSVIDKINKALIEVLAMPEVKERLAKIGADPAPGTPKEFDDLVVRELKENGELVKAAGIKAQ